tara:strand:- start:285 stop:491 length:207 start_codon:yes stop_codon:yes gene_type:complete
MDKRIVYINSDGTIGIIIPVNMINPVDNEEWTIEELAQKDVPTGLTYHIVDKSEIPTDRTFRDAWKWQ